LRPSGPRLRAVHPILEVMEHDRDELVVARLRCLVAVVAAIPTGDADDVYVALRGDPEQRRRVAAVVARGRVDECPAACAPEALELLQAQFGIVEHVVGVLRGTPGGRSREQVLVHVRPAERLRRDLPSERLDHQVGNACKESLYRSSLFDSMSNHMAKRRSWRPETTRSATSTIV